MESLENINLFALIAPFVIIQLILIIVACIDLVRREKTLGPKWVWLIIILFVSTIGPILYFVVGRKHD